MRIGIAAAAGVAALASFTALATVSARAADLGRSYAADPYEDPRYAEPYAPPPPEPRAYEEYDNERFAPPPGYREGRDYDDDDNDDDDYEDHDRRPRAYVEVEPGRVPPPPPPHYRLAERGYACLRRGEIRRRLRADGWRRFRDIALDGTTGIVRATRRGTFDAFELRVDRCTGAIVSVTPLDGRRYGYYEPRYGK